MSGRYAATGRCQRCGSSVLRGLDGDVCAFMIAADPQPLSVFGEALAILAGRSTYTLTRPGGRLRLAVRDPWQVCGRPWERADVIAEHECGYPARPDGWVPSAFRPAAKIISDDDQPPF